MIGAAFGTRNTLDVQVGVAAVEPFENAPLGNDHLEGQNIDWQTLEAIVHRDPAARGLASYRLGGRALDHGQLQRAAADLAGRATSAPMVTGFCALADSGVTAETDGPPGALFLARA